MKFDRWIRITLIFLICEVQGYSMSHLERVQNALAGKQTDRLPFTYWRHFPDDDFDPIQLSARTLKLQKDMDLDLVKFSPSGLFSVLEWGLSTKKSKPGHPHVVDVFPIISADDWLKLKPLSGVSGIYKKVLHAQVLTLQSWIASNKRIPLIQTVFSPLTSALKMVGKDKLLLHLRDHPEKLHAGLKKIAQTTKAFAEEAIKLGADGVFFATQTVGEEYLTDKEYRQFAKYYDLHVLENLESLGAWVNVLHMHGPSPRTDEILDYPVHAFSFHDREGPLSLLKMRQLTSKCLIGGLEPKKMMAYGDSSEVRGQILDAKNQLQGKGLIVGPACCGSVDAKAENIQALVDVISQSKA